MKINSALINKTYGTQAGSVSGKKTKSDKVIFDTASAKTDKVLVSQEAMTAKTIASAAKAITDELNEDYGSHRIAMLKEAIQNGTYHIDSEKIAQAMINHAKILGGDYE